MSELLDPTFDADGYPTDATLERIAAWPLGTPKAATELLGFCRRAWDQYYGSWEVDEVEGMVRHVLVTGGWSGNESVVAAMDRNTMLGLLCWWRSERGGLHEFREREVHQP